DVAACAPGAAGEDLLAGLRGARIEAADRRPRCIERQLIELQRGQLRCDEVMFRADVCQSGARGDRELQRIVQTWIVERALSVHFEVGDERVPMRYAAPSRRRVQVNARDAECGRDHDRARLPIRTKRLAVDEHGGIVASRTPLSEHRVRARAKVTRLSRLVAY